MILSLDINKIINFLLIIFLFLFLFIYFLTFSNLQNIKLYNYLIMYYNKFLSINLQKFYFPHLVSLFLYKFFFNYILFKIIDLQKFLFLGLIYIYILVGLCPFFFLIMAFYIPLLLPKSYYSHFAFAIVVLKINK